MINRDVLEGKLSDIQREIGDYREYTGHILLFLKTDPTYE